MVEALREQLNGEREADRGNERIIAGVVQQLPAQEAAREATPEPRGTPETGTPGATKCNAPASLKRKQQRSWLYRFFFGTNGGRA